MRRLTTVLLGSLLLVACQSQQANLLTDPVAILQAAAVSTASAKAVHIDAKADGPISFDPLGTGAGAAVNLRGTTATADIDITGNRLHASFASPNLLNLAGDVIAVDGTTYLKSSLTGAKYLAMTSPVGALPSAATSGAPDASAAASQALAGVTELLSRADLKPVKGDDVPCAGGTCYTVTFHLTAAQLQGLGGSSAGSGASTSPAPSASVGAGASGGFGALPGLGGALSGLPLPDLSTATADLAIHVEQTTNRLSGVDATLHLGDTGDPTVTLTFTKWDQPVTVQAPPADQVQAAP